MREKPDRLHSAIRTFELLIAAEASVRLSGPQGNDGAIGQGGGSNTGTIHHKAQGPVAGMMQVAALIGGQLQHNEEGFYVQSPNTKNSVSINKGPDNVWKQRAKECITCAVTNQLNSRLIERECEDNKKKKGCKDFFRITNAIGTFASTVLHKNKAIATLQRQVKFVACHPHHALTLTPLAVVGHGRQGFRRDSEEKDVSEVEEPGQSHVREHLKQSDGRTQLTALRDPSAGISLSWETK